MSDLPWLTIIGLGEDGPDGLCTAAMSALQRAEVIMGPPRHLGLIGDQNAKLIEWPVPFAEGIDTLMGLKGQKVVVLTSGDPFWYGAGAVITERLEPNEWQSFAGRSSFSLAANHMGWSLQETLCLGLHAAPYEKLRPHLYDGAKILVTLKNGEAVNALSESIVAAGFGKSQLTFLEALGGPRERITTDVSQTLSHPVMAAIEVRGDGKPVPLTAGLDDGWFDHDGQITKRKIRALTLSSLAPTPHEHLWDIGGGAGSVAIEWMLCHPSMSATSFEANSERAERIRSNATRFGLGHLTVVEGRVPETLSGAERPDAIFIGGGLSPELLKWLERNCAGVRIVANAVTLESEALLVSAQARLGGTLTKIELSCAQEIGPKRGWKAAYPIVQWEGVL